MTEEAWMTFMPDGTDDDVWYTNPEGKLPEGYTYQKLNPNWSKEMAQPEQEPIAFYNPQQGGFYWAKPTTISCPQTVDVTPLAFYTKSSQRTWVGLFDDEIMQIWGGIIKYAPSEVRIKYFARAIESKLKEVNT